MSKKDKGKSNPAEKWNSEDVIQAVVIADSFNFRFLPITLEKPRALLPLVNRPLIDYTVEFLAVSGVQEIFVFCCAHADMIREHLEKSRWMKRTSPVKLRVIVSEDCPSVGDALRDIDSQSLIHSDFVLVSGDLVANMDLKEVIEKHKATRKVDKLSVMTCVYKKANPNHPTRSSEDNIVIATNASNNRLLHCEKPSGKKKVTIALSVFEENREVELHYDVLDCHVSICSPSVPQLFSDNFDYQTRHHFIRGIIVNEEITGNHIFTHFITDQYAARVSNLRTYDAISRDVIHRWVYPLVPDNTTGQEYAYGRHNIYLDANVALSVGSVLHEDVVIGRGTKVGAMTQISCSTIGHNCCIGENVKIEGSYIWNDVTIEDNCTIRQAVLADGVIVKSNVQVEPGALLSYKVVIGPDFKVEAGSRLTTKHSSENLLFSSKWEDTEEEDNAVAGSLSPKELPTPKASQVGRDGQGYLWCPPEAESEEESDHLVVEKWPFDEESTFSSGSSEASSRSVSPVAMEEDTDAVMFYNEILDSIRSGVAELITSENTKLMINASKHAYNIPIQDVPLAVVKAILDGPQNSTTCQSSELYQYAKNTVAHFEPLLQHYIKGKDIQVNVLHTLADCAAQNPNALAIFAKVVLLFYHADILDEACIFSWHSRFQEVTVSNTKKVEILKCVEPVIEWLQSAEEESSEDGD